MIFYAGVFPDNVLMCLPVQQGGGDDHNQDISMNAAGNYRTIMADYKKLHHGGKTSNLIKEGLRQV